MGPDAVGAIYTDASSLRGWGAAFGDSFFQGKWSELDMRGGVNWQEPWVLKTALQSWGDRLAGKVFLVCMDNCAAVSYANYGAGRVPRVTLLARSMEELEVPLGRTAVALHIAGRRNAVADALAHFAIRARGLYPYLRRELRPRLRQEVVERCGEIDFDVLACDDGPNVWGPQFRPPSDSAFEAPLPPGQLWGFPRIDVIDLVLTRAASSLEED